MTAVIFLGPTCPREIAAAVLSASYRGPATRGDIYRAALEGAQSIGLIDGYFETTPAVLHKEILWAINQGIPVFGSASMGALRAAELADFGMRGIGAIFASFKDGDLEDDDEVAVLHGPAELNYLAITEAMVNIRATLRQAATANVISAATASSAERLAKTIFYKSLTYPALIDRMRGLRLPTDEISAFADWLPAGKIDQKRIDAIEMLRAMSQNAQVKAEAVPSSFAFYRTSVWRQLERHLKERHSDVKMSKGV